jgi:hypothetical protein
VGSSKGKEESGRIPSYEEQGVWQRLERRLVKPLDIRRKNRVKTTQQLFEVVAVRLKVGIAVIDEELEEGEVSILVLVDDLGHGRVSQETSGLVLESIGKQSWALILDVKLDKVREGIKPDTEGLVVGKGVHWWNVEAEIKMMTDDTGMPRKEGFRGIIDGHIVFQLVLDVLNVKWMGEAAKEQGFIHEAQIGRDGVAGDDTMIEALGIPWGRKTGVGINDEVRVERIQLNVSPTGAKTKRLLMALMKQRRTARKICEAIVTRRVSGWVMRSVGYGSGSTTLPIVLVNEARSGVRTGCGRAETRGNTGAKTRSTRTKSRTKARTTIADVGIV